MGQDPLEGHNVCHAVPANLPSEPAWPGGCSTDTFVTYTTLGFNFLQHPDWITILCPTCHTGEPNLERVVMGWACANCEARVAYPPDYSFIWPHIPLHSFWPLLKELTALDPLEWLLVEEAVVGNLIMTRERVYSPRVETLSTVLDECSGRLKTFTRPLRHHSPTV